MSRWWPFLLLILALMPAVLIRPPHVPTPTPVAVGGTVTIATLANPKTFDPAFARNSAEREVADNIFQPLYRVNSVGHVTADMAATSSFHGRQVVVQLKPQSLNNGQPVTADMVASSLARLIWVHAAAATSLRPIVGYRKVVSGHNKYLSGVKVTGQRTLTITLKRSAGRWFLRRLSNPALAIVPVGAMTEGGPNWQLLNLFGAGDYRMTAWNLSASVSFQRVKGHSGPRYVQMVVYPSFHQAVLSYINQAVDIVPISATAITQIPQKFRSQIRVLPVPGVLSLYINDKSKAGIATYPKISPRKWVNQAFLGRLPAVRTSTWPTIKSSHGSRMTIGVNQNNAEAVQLGRTLRKLSHGRVSIRLMPVGVLMADARSGSLSAYLGIVDVFPHGVHMALAPMTTFWLINPAITSAGVYADGSLNWHRLVVKP